ncbi:uncharacterized protein RCO7_10887 [Rhynchosporium graminicola]|uniref:Uncharacterized protein n=1 Tax=Rhynchosporium graminicola TaxID=2792576 RepID=A0A1E1LB82_9HELO|nr:uncharacterized protein RCO7_10887 [Rhynchosporium commune]
MHHVHTGRKRTVEGLRKIGGRMGSRADETGSWLLAWQNNQLQSLWTMNNVKGRQSRKPISSDQPNLSIDSRGYITCTNLAESIRDTRNDEPPAI